VSTTPAFDIPASRDAPPAPVALRVTRPRLLSALDDPAAVTVLQAPAGFGKSTLLRHWCATRSDVVWLAAGSAPEREWPAGGDPAALSTAPPPILVLDRADTIRSDVPDRVLGLLRARPWVRVVLAGRGSSWFPDDLLAELGGRVIGAEELLFTRDETAALLGRALPYLDPRGTHWADQVHGSTGGWPGIAAAVARRMAAAAADPVELSAVALRAAAEHLRRRLVPELERADAVCLARTTGLADRFTAAIADAVTGQAGSSARLDRLVTDGLLIAETVGGQTTYRWPAAARTVLVEELTLHHPERFGPLHTAWARCFLEHGRPDEAIRHAVAARDWPLVVTVIETAWRCLLHGDGRAIRAALTAAPPDALADSAHALALREILLFTPGSLPGSPAAAPTPPLPGAPASPAGVARLAGAPHLTGVLDSGLLVVAAHRHRGRQAAALSEARRLLQVADLAHATRPADVARHRPALHLAVGVGMILTGDLAAGGAALEVAYRHGSTAAGAPGRFSAAGAAGLLAMSHAVLGDVTTARRWLGRLDAIGVAAHSDRSVTHLQVASAVTTVLIALEGSDAGAADAAKDRLAVLDPASPWLNLWAFVCHAQAQYGLHHGDVDAALDRIVRARATHRHDLADGGIAAPLLAAAEVNLLLAAGRATHALRCLRAASPHWLLRVPQARLALLSGDTAEAGRLAADKAWERVAGTRDRVEMRLIRAIAARRMGDSALAAAVLSRAVRAAREAGLHSAWRTAPRAELADLWCPDAVPERPSGGTAGTGGMEVYPSAVVVVELTEREREVLDQLAAGATLERVAACLTISHNTVKTHAGNIYRKLRVDSRGAAIAEAGRVGLLPVPTR
jgi:LuxR family maltose regulon positive regulatory protein